jgi:hypothetical protein
MDIEKRGALCSNCQYEGGENKKQCNKCLTKDGRRGWEPKEGITVRITRDTTSGKMFWEVKSNDNNPPADIQAGANQED